jgi:hypothetical protein
MNEAAPGTIAHEAIQFLRRSTDGEEVSTTALANGIGRAGKRLAQHLSPALHAGLLARRVDAGFAFWRLGPKADVAQAPVIAADEKIVVKVSALAAPSIFAYADQRNAAPFSAALSTDGRLLVERHGRLLMELTNAERLVLLDAAQGVKAA